MIFVTVGTQKFQFNRLLDKVIDLIANEQIDDKLVVQKGETLISIPKKCEHKITSLTHISSEEFNKYIDMSDIVITHAGTGSIISSLNKNKKVIVCPRLKKYDEHVDDHQIEISEVFSSLGYVIVCWDVSKLKDIILNINEFNPRQYVSTSENVLNDLSCYVLRE